MSYLRTRDTPPRRPFFGRSEVVQEVERALDDIGTPRGKPILLVGEGGSGKSVLIEEAASRAEARGFLPVRGRATAQAAVEPFRLVRELFAAAGRDLEPAVDELLAGPTPPKAPSTDRLTTSEDDLARLLAPLGRTSVEGLGAVLQATRVRFLEWFEHLAQRRPVAVLVDDLHLADPGSLDFLEQLAREGPTKRVAFLATVDPGPRVPDRARAAIARWSSDGTFKQLDLRPFTSSEVNDFATWLRDGHPPAPEDVLRWHAETDGHPLFVELLVRSASGTPRRPSPGASPSATLTETLLQRLREVDEVARRVLTYASVLGREFDFDRLRAAVDLPEDRLSEAIDRLVKAGVLRERGGEIYEFPSEEFRASFYSGITETRRAILHRKVATALEARGGASDFELARHYYLGREDTKAIEFGVRAADEAARAYAFDTALTLVRQSLEAERRLAKRDPRLEVRLLNEAGRLMDEAGDIPGAHQALTEAVALARGEKDFDGPLGRALLGLAWTRVERSDYSAAEPLALEAAACLERAGTARDQFAAHRVLGALYWRRSDLDLAEQHQRAALEIAEREGTPHERGHALVDVANALLPRGPNYVDQTLTLYAQAAELFRQEDDPNATARVLMNRAVLEHRIGRLDEAMRDIGQALDQAERSRSPVWIGYCLLNLAHWSADLGETARATQLADRVERLLEPTGDRLARQQIQMIRGLIAEREERFEDAEREFAEALANARWMGMRAEVAEMLFLQARLASLRGDRPRARGLLGEAKANGLEELRGDMVQDIERLAATLEKGEPPSR